MDVAYYRTPSQNYQVALVRPIYLVPFLSGRHGGELCKCQFRSTSWSRKDTVNKDISIVPEVNSRNKVLKCHNRDLATRTMIVRLSPEIAAP